jgi:hypothetical protein
VFLGLGGVVSNNGTGALISGQLFSVIAVNSPATVINQGTISGSSGGGVLLLADGSVTNSGTGSVISSKYSGVYGVKTTTVTNQGSIASSADVGALFGGGGRLANTGTAASVFGANYGVLARYAAFTVTNSDRITGTAEAGVAFNDGGVVTDAAGAHITGGTVGVQGAGSTISVNNAGINTRPVRPVPASISSTAARSSTAAHLRWTESCARGSRGDTDEHWQHRGRVGLRGLFRRGGKLTNSSTTARVSGGTNGVLVTVGTAAVTNAGTIAATGGTGVLISVGGTVTNSGAATHITGLGNGVQATLGALTVINQGTISGSSGSGVFLSGGGSVSNGATAARITGGKFGVFFGGTTASTVTNTGTISGAVAVQFSNKANNNLFSEFPGAVTSGAVIGGSGTGNTVELGSAATTGTITGIGSQFVGFQVLDVDSGAKWLMSGANTLGSVATIELAGTGSLGVTGALTAPANLTITGSGTLAASGGGRIEMGSAGSAIANEIVVDATHTLTTSSVLSAATLAVASWGLLIGTGTLLGTMANAGTVEATGGTLDLTGSVDPASTGLFTINTASRPEIAADTGAGNTMSFIGSSGE